MTALNECNSKMYLAVDVLECNELRRVGIRGVLNNHDKLARHGPCHDDGGEDIACWLCSGMLCNQPT